MFIPEYKQNNRVWYPGTYPSMKKQPSVILGQAPEYEKTTQDDTRIHTRVLSKQSGVVPAYIPEYKPNSRSVKPEYIPEYEQNNQVRKHPIP